MNKITVGRLSTESKNICRCISIYVGKQLNMRGQTIKMGSTVNDSTSNSRNSKNCNQRSNM